MFLSSILNVPFVLNTDPGSIEDFNFNNIKPKIFNNNRKLIHNGKLFKLVDDSVVEPEIAKTNVPVLNGPDGVNEGTGNMFTFTMPDGADIVVWAKKGKIESLNKTKLTFIYMAPDIIKSTSDIEDELYAYAIKPGALRSDTVIKKITVHYVPLEADDALSNPDFKTHRYDSKNIEYL